MHPSFHADLPRRRRSLFLTAHRNALVIRNTGSGTLSAYGSKTETPAIAHTAVKLGELIFFLKDLLKF